MHLSRGMDTYEDASKPVTTALPAMQSAGLPTSWSVDAAGPIIVESNSKTSCSLIDRALIITGNVTAKGPVQVEGEVRGDVCCSSLVVGEKAIITGGIMAEEVIIGGRVMGSVRARHVTLQSTSRVEGDVHHQSLTIRQGAVFNGKAAALR